MTEPGPPAERASDDDRERTVALLRDASVEGRLSLDELAERTERAHLALTRPELAELTADLGSAPPAPVATAPERNRILFSGHARRGRWRPARTSRYVNVCGTLDLDLRQAVLPGPELELEISSWFGTTTVLVPEGVEVDLTGGGFGATRRVEVEGEPGPDAPIVRVRTRGPFGTLNVRSRPRLRHTGDRSLAEGFTERRGRDRADGLTTGDRRGEPLDDVVGSVDAEPGDADDDVYGS